MNIRQASKWLKKATCIIILALTALTGTYAQPQKERFSPEEFRMHLEGFVSREAGLTGSEAKAFFPLYHQMKEEQRALQDEIFRLKRNGPANNAPDKEFQACVQKIKNLEVKKAEVEEQYYKKMCKAIPARKVYLAMKAEDKFHRRMLDDFKRRDKGRR